MFDYARTTALVTGASEGWPPARRAAPWNAGSGFVPRDVAARDDRRTLFPGAVPMPSVPFTPAPTSAARAGALGAPSGGAPSTAPSTGASRRSLVLLAAATVIGLLHHTDHVLRVDHSGWPFLPKLTPFTPSLLAYVLLYGAYHFRARPRVSAVLVGVVLVFVLAAHVFIETPHQQYDVWATGVSHLPHALGTPNLLHVTSPALGVAAAVLSILLAVALLATTLSFWADARGSST